MAGHISCLNPPISARRKPLQDEAHTIHSGILVQITMSKHYQLNKLEFYLYQILARKDWTMIYGQSCPYRTPFTVFSAYCVTLLKLVLHILRTVINLGY